MPRFAAPYVMSKKWQNSAARRRCHEKSRRKLCRMLGWHFECIATYGEMLAELKRQRREGRGIWAERIPADILSGYHADL